MDIEKISNRQLWFILFMMRTTVVMAILPVFNIYSILEDAWISGIIALVISEIFVYSVSALSIKFPNLTIVEYSQLLLGKNLGKFLSIIFLAIFLLMAAIDIRLYSEVIITGFFAETPIVFITSAMVIVSALCIYFGIEVLGRSADALFGLFTLMILVVIMLTSTAADLKNIQPILARGLIPVFRGSLSAIALGVKIWVLGMLVPATNAPKKATFTSLTSIGASFVVLIIVTILSIGVLGPYESNRAVFPFLSMIRSIEAGDFLPRAEALIIFAWGFGIFITVSVYLYSGAKGIAQLLDLNDYKPLVFPMSIIWITMSIHSFTDIYELEYFLQPPIIGAFGLFFLIFPLLLLWIGYLIKRRKDNQ